MKHYFFTSNFINKTGTNLAHQTCRLEPRAWLLVRSAMLSTFCLGTFKSVFWFVFLTEVELDLRSWSKAPNFEKLWILFLLQVLQLSSLLTTFCLFVCQYFNGVRALKNKYYKSSTESHRVESCQSSGATHQWVLFIIFICIS